MSNNAKHVAPKKPTDRADGTSARREDWVREDAAYVGRAAGGGNKSGNKSGKTKKKGWKRALLIVLIVVAVLVILAEVLYLIFGHFYSKMNFSTGLTDSERAAAIAGVVLEDEDDDFTPDENLTVVTDEETDEIHALIQSQLNANGGSMISDSDVINILLIGTDARSLSERARSDVMMLVSVNRKTDKIVLTSFMRDIYTYIPGYGYNRLNAPNAIAGPDYLIETLEADFGIEINNYALVNFYAFADIIDVLGGIDLYLTNAEVDFINKQAYYGEQADLGVGTGAVYLDYSSDGWYHLNGTQALAHCRNRSSSGSDYDRTERQRTVIGTLIGAAKSASLSELYNLADTILPMVTTDLTQGDCLSLLLKSADYLTYDVESVRIPAVDYSGAMISGMSVIQVDFSTNAAYLQDIIYN